MCLISTTASWIAASQICAASIRSSLPVKLFQAIAISRKGQRAQALNLIHSVENSPVGKSAPLYWYALAYASLQDEPNTLKWLNRSADAHEWQTLFLAVDPSFSWMRDHSGMQQLKRRIGLA